MVPVQRPEKSVHHVFVADPDNKLHEQKDAYGDSCCDHISFSFASASILNPASFTITVLTRILHQPGRYVLETTLFFEGVHMPGGESRMVIACVDPPLEDA